MLAAMEKNIIDQFDRESTAFAATARLFDDGLAVGNGCACCIESGLCLVHLALEGSGIDACDELPLRDPRVEVGEECLDVAGDLGSYLNRDNRIGISGCRNTHIDVTASHGCCSVLDIRVPLSPLPGGQRQQDTRRSPDNCRLPAVMNRHGRPTIVAFYVSWTGREISAV